MGNSCKTCNKKTLAKILTSLIILVSYLYDMYSVISSKNSLTDKIINGVRHSFITIVNFYLLYFFDLTIRKMEPKVNVEVRVEDNEEFDAIKNGEILLLLLSKVALIVEKLKGLEAQGDEKAGIVLRSIEEKQKPLIKINK